MSARTLKPTGDYLLIKPDVRPAVSNGGIALPETWQTPADSGTVLAVGRGKHNRKGVLIPIPVEPGQRVSYKWTDGEFAGRTVEWEGQTLKFLQADQIIGIVEKP